MTNLDAILNDARTTVKAVEAALTAHNAGYDTRTIKAKAADLYPNVLCLNLITQCLHRDSRDRGAALDALMGIALSDLKTLEARILPPAPVQATAPIHNKTHFVTATVGSSWVTVKADFQARRYPRDMSKSRIEESVSCLNEFIKNEFKFTVVSVVTTMGDNYGDLRAIVTCD